MLLSEGAKAQERGELYLRNLDGDKLPSFLRMDISLRNGRKGQILLHGTPSVADIGVLTVGIYDGKGVRVGVTTIEVVPSRI